MIEVGLNGLLLDSPFSGSATYTRELVPRLPGAAPDMRFRLFVRRSPIDMDFGVPIERLESAAARFDRGSGVGARLNKLVWETYNFPAAGLRHRESLLHSLYFAAPPFAPMPRVVTVHDAIPLVADGYHRTRQSARYAHLMAVAARRAAAIITVSQHSKGEIVSALNVPADRVYVTYEAAPAHYCLHGPVNEAEAVRLRYGLPRSFVLYLGGAERRKNLETLIRAWAAIAPEMRRRNTQLVVVARFPPPDSLYPDIAGLVRSLHLNQSVRLVPEVRESDKAALYRAARAFVFPSRHEGFGLPPLEAMACGCPVAVSNATSLPEVVGDAGLLVDPDDVPGWSEAIAALVDVGGPRERLRDRGIARSRQFAWSKTAELTAEVYRSVLG